MEALLVALLVAGPQMTAGNSAAGMTVARQIIPVTVRVEFGPANLPAFETVVRLPRKDATPGEAVRQALPAEKGAVCCHPEEIKGIGGVSVDPLNNRWWRVAVNGESKRVSPHKTRLKAGDVVLWTYFQEAQ
ncbi:MAG: DUF4430 domain-containing protein [Candidatus Omnitrophica bacterium]|nr:DUF4430 domain-containing protein [Candidatus Omnitrophota bacterium]